VASILVVCTGNVCRSPIAEAMLRSALRDRLDERAPTVASAGTAGWVGSPAEAGSITAAAELGFDLSAHRGRRLREHDLAEATLVIAMSGEHRDHVWELHPRASSRTFTLKELVRLLEAEPAVGEDTGRDRFDPERALRDVVALADERRRAGAHRDRADEDIVDPLGMPIMTFRAVATELEEWCARLVDALFGPAPMRAVSIPDHD
jgi:protein-tyrosine phosphatase